MMVLLLGFSVKQEKETNIKENEEQKWSVPS